MTWMLNYPSLFLAYFLLFLSVLLLWYPGKRKVPNWAVSFILAVFFGFCSRQLEWTALLIIALFTVAVYYSLSPKLDPIKRQIATALVLFLSLGLASHQWPGFNSFQVLDHVYLTTDALAFSLYLDFDKVVIGILILGFGPPLISSFKEAKKIADVIWPKVLTLILGLMILSFILGYVRLEPKLSSHIVTWALYNLFFTCVAEEALFREFIQGKLQQQFKNLKYGNLLALLIASLFFGLAHYAGGRKYIFLATVAGLGYGWIYQRTQRIEASILAHFSLNLFHFLFFTYPALATASA